MHRFIVVVIDSFGVGAMSDCPLVRPTDVGTNTALHLIERERLSLESLEALGIMNALGVETETMHFSHTANWTISRLAHVGADTFQGHQEIMGSIPKAPVLQAFGEHIDETQRDLESNGYEVRRLAVDGNQVLIVNEGTVCGDNLETDLGQVINVSSTFRRTSFEETKKIGQIVRKHYQVSRVIALGGETPELQDLVDSIKTKGIFIGLDTPASGVYERGYLVQHIGYGIDSTKQVIHALSQRGVPTYLYGKAADIISNERGVNFYGVDTQFLMDKLIADIQRVDTAFFCLNVQETDLAGHECDSKKYAKVLGVVDDALNVIMGSMDEGDRLVVMADHGNDPYSGSSRHTRENVPILFYDKIHEGFQFPERETMADVGQSVASYFGTAIENGTAIFENLK